MPDYRLNAGFINYLQEIQQLTAEFLNQIVADLQAYLAANNRNATGRSSASIQPANIDENGGQVIGGSWITWVFTGRGPGGFPPISAIIDWLNAKGLPRAMAWNVAGKIAREGTELFKRGGRTNNALTEILTEERINEFAKNIAKLVAVELTNDIQGVFA